MKDGRVIENGLTNLFDGAANHFKSGSDGETLKSSNKYEIVTYNQNSHEHLTISALIVKVSDLFQFEKIDKYTKCIIYIRM